VIRAGLAAEFATADALLVATERLQRAGYEKLDAFTPHPMPELARVLRLGRSRLNWAVFPLGIGGALFAFALQGWSNGYDYPINVGGRPPYAWVSNIPITFETGVLATALAVFVGLFWTIGLPALAHPLFAIDGFERASIDRFWLAIAADDPGLDPKEVREQLRALGAVKVVPFGGYVEGP
jgi:hypothetical protein